jgi:hypothetical protein
LTASVPDSIVQIRYYLDEHVDPAVAAGLRHRGVAVTTTLQAGLAGASDSDQLSLAADHGCVLVTRDRHYLMLAKGAARHAGIAFWHSRHRSIGRLVLDLTLLWRISTAEEMIGRIEYF